MVFLAPLISAVALFSGFASAAPRPRPDSAIGDEVAVSAPNGIILSDTVELASQKSAEAAASSSAFSAIVSSSAVWDSASVVTAAPYAQATTPPYVASSAAVYTPPPAIYASPSSAAAVAYSSPSYGSGSNSWGSAYDSCVQQCVASFGGLAPASTPPAVAATGATHTVIVAPTQGVLRYVPFTVNATVGDTIHFVWNANNHTVTKSSQLEVCNKTTTSLFASGTHDKGFTFDQVVNDTNPTFFYCATPTHCQKGMFGIINAPSVANNVNTSVAMMMSSLTASNPQLAAEASYVNSKTVGLDVANTWGGNIDMSAFPDWAHQYVAENVLYARSFFAQNPDVIKDDGSINLNTNAPLSWPDDLSKAVAAVAASSSGSPAATSAVSSSPSGASSAAVGGPTGSANTPNSATTKAISSTLLVAAAIAGAFLTL